MGLIDKLNELIAANVRAEMAARGLSAAEVSRRAGQPAGWLARKLRQGLWTPCYAQVDIAAEGLGTTHDRLLEGGQDLVQRDGGEVTVVNHDWLQAISDHPGMRDEDLLAAYHHVGVPTDRTQEQLDESTFKLQLWGFLDVVDISDDGMTYTYSPSLGEEA